VQLKLKVKRSRYRPGVAQRVGRGIALLFHDRGTNSTPRPHFTPGKDPVPILQETGWAPGPAWTVGKSRPHRDSIPDRPAHSQSLYRLSYRAHTVQLSHRKEKKMLKRRTNYTPPSCMMANPAKMGLKPSLCCRCSTSVSGYV